MECSKLPKPVMAKWGLQWVGLSALMLASSVAMVNGEAQMSCQGGGVLKHPAQVVQSSAEPGVPKVIAGRYGAMGMDNMGTVFSLCFMFIVGVSTGFLWKGFQKVGRNVMNPTSPSSTSSSSSSPPSSPELRTRKIARANSVGSLKQYRLKEILDMTDRFKQELGRGGQGIVYLATLPDGRGKAAVKRLQKKETTLVLNHNVNDHHSQEMIEKAFWAELKTISRLHHRNLVQVRCLRVMQLEEKTVPASFRNPN